jgi:hypothetical protein
MLFLHFTMVMKLGQRWWLVLPRALGKHQKIFRVVYQNVERSDFAIDKDTVPVLPTRSLHIIAIHEVREGLIRSLRLVRWGQLS